MNEQRGHGEIMARARDGAAAALCRLCALHELFLSLKRAAMLRQTRLCEGVKKQSLRKKKAGGAKAESLGCLGKVRKELEKGQFVVATNRTPGFNAVLAEGELAATGCSTEMAQTLMGLQRDFSVCSSGWHLPFIHTGVWDKDRGSL